jgi:hypothetical protein
MLSSALRRREIKWPERQRLKIKGNGWFILPAKI